MRAGDTGNEHRAAVAAGRVRQALRDTAPLARRVLPRCGRELPREASGPRGAHLDRKVSQEGRRAIALAICFRHFVLYYQILDFYFRILIDRSLRKDLSQCYREESSCTAVVAREGGRRLGITQRLSGGASIILSDSESDHPVQMEFIRGVRAA